MLPVGTLLLIVPLLGNGVRLDAATAVDTQTGAGVLPIQPNEPSTPASETSLALLSGVRISTARTSLQLSYRPSFLLQVPNALSTVRPLVLHQLVAGYQSSLSYRTTLQVSLLGSAGEVSYAAQQQVFAPGSSPADVRLVPLAFGSASSTLSHQTSRRNVVATGLSAGYSAPLSSSEASAALFPESFSAAATVSDGYSVTSRDRLTLTVTTQYLKTSQLDPRLPAGFGTELSTYGATVGWNHVLSPRTAVGISGGGALTHELSTGQLGFIPEGTLEHSTNWRPGRIRLSSMLNGGVRGFLDRLAGMYIPQGFLGWNLRAEIGRSWTTGARAFASTSLAETPMSPPQYESFASLEQPTTFRISQNAELRFGVRSSLRGPHLRADTKPSPEMQPELMGFVGFRYGLGTDQQKGSWLR